MKIIATLLLCALLASPSAQGQSTALADQPGYVDFGDLSNIAAGEPKVEISIGSVLLSFLAEATSEDDNELADALSKLLSVRVSVFDLDAGNLDEAKAHVKAIAGKLENDNWESAVTIRSEESLVHMYLKSYQGQIAGMTVMVIEPGSDAVFMNIVGEIDPGQLGRVANKFGVPVEMLGQ